MARLLFLFFHFAGHHHIWRGTAARLWLGYYFYSFTSLDITTYGEGQQLGCGSVTISILSLRWTSPHMERDGVSRDKRTLLSSGVSRIRQLEVGAGLQTFSRH